MNTASSVDIAPLGFRHWDRVRDIYLEGLATGEASFETRAPDWTEWDRAHLAWPRLVATLRNEVVGWVALCPVSQRKCYAGVAEISIYVAGEARGRGVGTLLLNEAVRASEETGLWTLQAVVFPTNLRSIRLHEACGFRVVGRRQRVAQREGEWRDTLLLERRSAVVGV